MGTRKIFNCFACAVTLTALVLLPAPCEGYYGYQAKLPNGQNVPHPCKANFIWHGVGHLSSLGGGERNQFGKDFAQQGHKWTPELCRLDSDGDGLTNGQELGDPDCVWSEGAVPQHNVNISHPGVCDPWGSDRCGASNTWVDCDAGEFKCDAIHEPDVRNITMRFPRTKVPTDVTTYECFVFDFPSDQEYHVIATQPYIDNPNVMHHIVAYGCDESASLMDAPAKCEMGAMGCNTVLGIWTLGMDGDCGHPHAGFLVGKGASTRVALQFHWTNKGHVDHWYDSSGLTFHYTPKLRANNAGVMVIGQIFLEVPPGVAALTTTGTCHSHCTQKHMTSDINVISVLNHMHYLGVGGNVQHIRDNRVIANMSVDEPYSYDSPHVHRYSTPTVLRPGDELKMICEYSSLSRDHTTKYGPGSFDEMCFGIITYFPAENWKIGCTQWKDMDSCDFADNSSCHRSDILNSSLPATSAIINEVLSHCNVYGSCLHECGPVLTKLKQRDACFRGVTWDYLKTRILEAADDTRLMKLVSAVDTCDQQSDQSAVGVGHLFQPAATTTQGTTTAKDDHRCNLAAEKDPSAATGSKTGAAEAFMSLARELGNRPLLQNIIFNNNNAN